MDWITRIRLMTPWCRHAIDEGEHTLVCSAITSEPDDLKAKVCKAVWSYEVRSGKTLDTFTAQKPGPGLY